MNEKEKEKYNRMLRGLRRILKYEPLKKLARDSVKNYGLDYKEALEMSYESMQDEAREAARGLKFL